MATELDFLTAATRAEGINIHFWSHQEKSWERVSQNDGRIEHPRLAAVHLPATRSIGI